MNAVSVAAPSVWNQLMSPGTLRKRKYLTPPTRPERSSSQSSGYMIAPWICCFGVCGRVAIRESSMRGLDGIKPGLEAAHVLAGVRERPLVDRRGGSGPVDARDGEWLADEEVPVANRVGVAVERTDGRAGGAAPLRVVLAAVTRAAEPR